MTNAAIAPPPGPEPIHRGIDHLASIQRPDGAWEGEVVWNSMLLAQYIFVRTIVAGRGDPPFDERTRRRMIRAFEVTRAPDGGWGMHPASPSYVFFTTLAYVAIRLLGVGPDDPLAAGARRFLRAQPGRVLGIPSWGKLWLAILGLYGYEGVNPIPPELFLLPSRTPFHPDNYYCHTRYIYLGMAYLYGLRYRADLGPITADLRSELFDQPFEAIDFSAHRHDIAETDLYVRPGRALRLAYDALVRWEAVCARGLRGYALRRCFSRILYEMRVTQHEALSPVNGLLNCLAIHATDPAHPDLAPSLAGMEAWRWDDEEEGIRYAGARSNAWDTAFALRAAIDAPRTARSLPAIRRGYAYLKATQLRQELHGFVEERRDRVLGGFCFSDGRHRWPVSDCTAEALSAILTIHDDAGIAPRGGDRFEDEWILAAARFILDRQNEDGGFATYERRRGGPLLEAINPSEMFGSCMTERSYIECTASCVGALARLTRATREDGGDLLDDAERSRVEAAIDRGVRFLRRAQRPDGAWPGFWGVNYTYAIFHVLEALHAVGKGSSDPAVERAVRFLVATQKSDGGWGEHYTSCLEGRYIEHSESQASMTAWALLALLAAGEPAGSLAVSRAARWLALKQRADGSWPRQDPSGVFFGTAMLDYRLYKDYFSLWALGRHAAALKK